MLLLEEQDRSLWDQAMIAEGTALIASALRGGRPGRFALQAAIAALHAEAPSYAQTDWPQIVALYDLLLRVWSSPVVALNRAVAVAMAQGPAAGLAQIGELEAGGRLDAYRYLPAAKADLLRRLGRWEAAAQAYRDALALTDNAAEREFLSRRLTEVTGPPAAGPGEAVRARGGIPFVAHWLSKQKRAPGSVKLRAGGDSPRPVQARCLAG